MFHYREDLSVTDYVDAYSTVFAYKRPGQAGAYDRRLLSLADLLPAAIDGNAIPEGRSWATHANVFLRRLDQPNGECFVRPMPDF